jgi:hypothetical protein
MIPLIIAGAALVAAALGAKKAIDGYSDISVAGIIGARAEANHKAAVSGLKRKRTEVNEHADSHGRLLIGVRGTTIDRFVKFVEGLGQKGSMEAWQALEGIQITPPQLQEYKMDAVQAHEVALGISSAVASGAGASAGTTALIGLLGTASTGTAISGLTGVAATNATLAWLGGGSLAAGGGGMALGTVILGGIVLGPAILVGGLVLGSSGEKALTEARAYESRVDQKIAEIEAVIEFMDWIIVRINELRDLILKLDGRANQALDKLNSTTFNVQDETDIKRFQQAGLLVKALAEILKTPVLDQHGQLTAESQSIQVKYRTLAG